MKKRILLIILLIPSWVFAQQDQLYSQYLFNMLALNPAYAGSKEEFNSVVFYRNQWAGFEGAPTTLNASFHMPFMDNNGAGLNIASDKIGVQTRTTVNLSYAYKIRMGKQRILSAGLQGTLNFYLNDYGKIFTNNPVPDPVFANSGTLYSNKPNIGFGIYYRSTKLSAGFSIPNLLNSRIEDASAPSSATIQRHFLLTAAYYHELNEKIALKPGFFVRYVKNAPIQVDVNLTAIFMKRFYLGASYRTNAAFSAMTQFVLNNHFAVGYNYDFNANRLSNYINGSHEFFLSYSIPIRNTLFLNPRYF